MCQPVHSDCKLHDDGGGGACVCVFDNVVGAFDNDMGNLAQHIRKLGSFVRLCKSEANGNLSASGGLLVIKACFSLFYC